MISPTYDVLEYCIAEHPLTGDRMARVMALIDGEIVCAAHAVTPLQYTSFQPDPDAIVAPMLRCAMGYIDAAVAERKGLEA